MRTKAKRSRPRWASSLSAKDWKHLREAQSIIGTAKPTLATLRANAATCRECALILRTVEVSRNG